jgi:hypothetical protein
MIRLLALLAFLCFGCDSNSRDGFLSVEKNGNTIKVSGTTEEQQLIVFFKSARNKQISSHKESSPNDPNFGEEKNICGKTAQKWDILYPIADIKIPIGSSFSGVVLFDSLQRSSYSINGMFFKDKKEFEGDSLVLEGKYLFEWENNLYLDKLIGSAMNFVLVDSIQTAADGRVNREYELLDPKWEGEITISDPGGKLCSKWIRNSADERIEKEYSYTNDLSKDKLLASLKASIDFTLTSQNQSVNDMTRGGLYLFYDYEAMTLRRSTWIWSWEPSIKLLLGGARIPELAAHFTQDSLKKVALEMGETSLKFQNKDKASPAYGVATSRWSETKNMGERRYDFEQFYSVADGQFQAGWGWMPLYTQTGDNRFLEASRLQTEATARLIKEMGSIPMDYMVQLASWKDYMLSEQGFGMEGINELYRVETKDRYEVHFWIIGLHDDDMLMEYMDSCSILHTNENN